MSAGTLDKYLDTLSQEEKAIIRLQGGCKTCYHVDMHHKDCLEGDEGTGLFYAPYIPLTITLEFTEPNTGNT